MALTAQGSSWPAASDRVEQRKVRHMVLRRIRRKEFFTIEEANATLPLVRAIVADLAGLSREVVERRRRLSLLMEGRQASRGDPYHDELLQIEEELDKDGRRLQGFVEELRQLGVEPTSGPEGLVDFPAMIGGRLVCLCWKLGEPAVGYWHEVNAGFGQRQPLAVERAAQPLPTTS
jgi:hypothetical protein